MMLKIKQTNCLLYISKKRRKK